MHQIDKQRAELVHSSTWIAYIEHAKVQNYWRFPLLLIDYRCYVLLITSKYKYTYITKVNLYKGLFKNKHLRLPTFSVVCKLFVAFNSSLPVYQYHCNQVSSTPYSQYNHIEHVPNSIQTPGPSLELYEVQQRIITYSRKLLSLVFTPAICLISNFEFFKNVSKFSYTFCQNICTCIWKQMFKRCCKPVFQYYAHVCMYISASGIRHSKSLPQFQQ